RGASDVRPHRAHGPWQARDPGRALAVATGTPDWDLERACDDDAPTTVVTMSVRIVDSADVAPSARIGDGSSVWHLAQVREDAELGENCIVGRGAYIGTGVHVGKGSKIQNYALVY